MELSRPVYAEDVSQKGSQHYTDSRWTARFPHYRNNRAYRTEHQVIRKGNPGKEYHQSSEMQRGEGRKGKAADVEEQILAELEKGNYHTRQQIADMVKEKFDISMSVWAIGRFLRQYRTEKRVQ